MSEVAASLDEAAEVRRTIMILAVCGFASALSARFVDPLIGAIARDLAADPLNVALLSTAYALPYALIQPILGPVGDALGKERVTKVIIVALTIVLIGATLAPNLPSLFAFRILSGLAAGGIIPIALATIGDKVAMRDRQVAIGRFLAATISGQFLGGTISGLLAEAVGWRGAFAAAGAAAAIASAAVLIGFRGRSVARGELSFRAAAGRYRQILAIGKARALMAFVFAEGIFIFGVQPYIAPLLEAAKEGGPKEAGLISGGFAIGGILYTVAVAWLLRVLGLGRMLAASGFIAAIGFGGLAATLPWYVEVGAMMLIGVGFYMMHNSFQTQMTEVMPQARASAIAMHAFSFFVGQALGPVTFGFLLASTGRVGAMAICATGVIAMGLLAAAAFGERQPRAL